jgi:hypothetical protein
VGRLLIATALLALAAPAWADFGFDAGADVRAIASDGEQSYLNGGLGLLRFDADHAGLKLGSAWIEYHDDAFDIVHTVVDAVSYGDDDRYPIDLTEAYVELRPYPFGAWRSRLKVGAFYAPISLENRLVGWRSPYTLSFSAINTWIGEELRTIGTEYDLDWLGRQQGHAWQLGVVASAYGFNNSAGELMAIRGWSLNDRQTTLFGRIGEPGVGPVHGIREFYGNFGGGVGYYAGGHANYRDELELRGLHYDNRADPADYSSGLHDYAWHTVFDSAGASWTPDQHWTVISQWLGGYTCVAEAPYCFQYSSAFLLTSWQLGADRLSARYDGFQMHQQDTLGNPAAKYDRGHAWTAAYQRDLNDTLSVALEGLLVHSSLTARRSIGEPETLLERELQLAVRVEL